MDQTNSPALSINNKISLRKKFYRLLQIQDSMLNIQADFQNLPYLTDVWNTLLDERTELIKTICQDELFKFGGLSNEFENILINSK
jgi:phenylalanine-4-hydroxylase